MAAVAHIEQQHSDMQCAASKARQEAFDSGSDVQRMNNGQLTTQASAKIIFASRRVLGLHKTKMSNRQNNVGSRPL